MARLAGWGAEETPTPTPAPGLIEKALTVFQNWGSSGPGDYYNDGLVNSLDFAQALL